MSLSLDASELRALAADIGRAPRRVTKDAVEHLEDMTDRGARLARDKAPGSRHARHYPRSITGEVRAGLGRWVGEFGPDKGLTQGALGNLMEFGSVNNGPTPHVGPALDEVEGPYVRGLLDLAAEAVLSRGA